MFAYVLIVLCAFAFIVGCTGPGGNGSTSSQAVTNSGGIKSSGFPGGSYPSDKEDNVSVCPVPILIFNDTQPVTRISRNGIRFGPQGSQTNGGFNVPLGGVVYHVQGFTRIFDSSGHQVLIVNDSESIAMTPEGPVSATYVYGGNGQIFSKDEKTWVIHSGPICYATVITLPGVKPPVYSTIGPH